MSEMVRRLGSGRVDVHDHPKLDLPMVWKVREVVVHDGVQYLDQGSFVLIAPAISGSRARYSVIRVDRKTGLATCIGRELDLALARKVAGRPASEDGKAVT